MWDSEDWGYLKRMDRRFSDSIIQLKERVKEQEVQNRIHKGVLTLKKYRGNIKQIPDFLNNTQRAASATQSVQSLQT